MSTYSTYSSRLHRHSNNVLHHTIHSAIPFFGEDTRPISFIDWIWDIEKSVQPLFCKYSQSYILSHVISRFVRRACEWWHHRQFQVEKGRASCINTFYELKACMYIFPSSYRITREQQSRLKNFIDIGDAFIQNLKKFSRQERDFKDKLDLLLSKKREIEKQREIKKQRDHVQKEKKEKERRDREDNERKESNRALREKREKNRV